MADAEQITVAELRPHLLESEAALFDGIVARAVAEAERRERYELERQQAGAGN